MTKSPDTPQQSFALELRARIKRAEQRMDRAESDGEWEACRQVVVYLRALLDANNRRAA